MRQTVIAAVLLLIASASGAIHAQSSSLPAWKLDHAPFVTIEGEGPAEFYHITGVVRLSTGHIAVVNAGTNEVRIFDGSGRHVSTFGRLGSGPGEFRGPGFVWRAGDTLMIDDTSLLRLTAILGGSETKLVRVIPTTARSNRNVYSLRGRTPEGKWLAMASDFFQLDGPPGVRRLKAFIGVVAEDGNGTVEWIAEIPSTAYRVHNPGGDVRKGGSVGPIPFSPWAFAATTTTHTWFGESSTDSLTATRGGERWKVRLPMPSRRTSSTLMEAFRAQAITRARTEEARAAIKRTMTADQFPRQLPYYEALVPGVDGELWVQEYAGINSTATRYLVIGRDLRPRAWVPVPAGFRVRDVGRDYVAGVHFDADDVETVLVYRLSR